MRVQNEDDGGGAAPGPVSLEVVLGVFAVAWGIFVIAAPLTDNSFFTHLATGRLILEDGSVPSSDPYSFTAPGTAWTVQSWIPSVLYAGAERLAGVAGLRVIGVALGAITAGMLWRLTRPCQSLIPRVALLFGAIGACSGLWSVRPYMVGVIGLGLVWLVVDEVVPPWVLVPTFWLWANSHGSFPLGLGLVVLLAIGTRLDGDLPARAVRCLGFAAAGTVAAVIGPLGFRALTFPVTALKRSDVLSNIAEWQPAEFTDIYERMYLVLVLAALLALLARPSWRHGLPTVAFVLAGMLAQRNLVMATMVLVPVAASGIGSFGELRTTDRPRRAMILAVVGVALVAVVGYATASRPLGAFSDYPARHLAALGPGVRLASHDSVGNLVEVLDGPTTPVFFDDRVDMYPIEVIDDVLVLHRGRPGWQAVLDDHEIDLVVWRREAPLAALLAADGGWQVSMSDPGWITACRRGTCADVLDPRPRS